MKKAILKVPDCCRDPDASNSPTDRKTWAEIAVCSLRGQV